MIQPPNSFSCQIFRTYGRFVWTKLEYKHANPSGGGNQLPRLFQFVIEISFGSRAYPDYHASILARATGWSSGARRPANCSKAHLAVGDAIELIHVQGEETENLSARSWRPADELKWKTIDDRSFRSSNLHGLTIDCRPGMPRVGRQAPKAHYAPRDNTEPIAQFPDQVVPARLINRWLNSKGSPPPPPFGEAWGGGRPTRWGKQADKAPAQENEEEAPAWDDAAIELSSAVRMGEPGLLDNASLDRISLLTGTGLSQAPSVFSGESAIQTFQWAVAPEACRSQRAHAVGN